MPDFIMSSDLRDAIDKAIRGTLGVHSNISWEDRETGPVVSVLVGTRRFYVAVGPVARSITGRSFSRHVDTDMLVGTVASMMKAEVSQWVGQST